MIRNQLSFKIKSKGKIFDYRLGEKINLTKIKIFFQKKYRVKKIWCGGRHVLEILNQETNDYFLKLATSGGISIVTQNEYKWNDYFNKYFPKTFPFRVPINLKSGFYGKNKFYLITNYFDGKLLCGINEGPEKIVPYIDKIILFSEQIQKMPQINFQISQYKKENSQQKFISKVNRWFNDIPADVRKKFNLRILLEIIEKGKDELVSRPRHGDFTPWHLIKLKDSNLGLIDGEHALSDGVEGYDICYFIQRVFSVLKSPTIARNIYFKLLDKKYKKSKLKTVLAARAIGGFLDDSLVNSKYSFANQFKEWVVQL